MIKTRLGMIFGIEGKGEIDLEDICKQASIPYLNQERSLEINMRNNQQVIIYRNGDLCIMHDLPDEHVIGEKICPLIQDASKITSKFEKLNPNLRYKEGLGISITNFDSQKVYKKIRPILERYASEHLMGGCVTEIDVTERSVYVSLRPNYSSMKQLTIPKEILCNQE